MNGVTMLLSVSVVALVVMCGWLWKKCQRKSYQHDALLKSLQNPVMIVNRDGNVISVLSHPPMNKYGAIDGDGKFNLSNYIISSQEVEMRKNLITHCLDNKTSGAVTVHVRTVQGKVHTVNLSVSSESGVYAVETSVDVSDYLEAENKKDMRYRALAKQLRLMMRSAGAMPWVMGSKEECEVIGGDRSGLPDEYQAPESAQLHLQDNDFAAVDEEFRSMVRSEVQSVFNGEKSVAVFEYKGRILKRMKESIWFRSYCTPLRIDADGKVQSVVGTTRIIDKEKNDLMEIAQAKERAEKNDRMKSLFLSSMSHEVRTPLNVILGFSQLLATAESEKEKTEYEKIIESNGELLVNIVDDILDIVKIEAGEFKISKEKIEINSVCELAVDSMKSKTRDGGTLTFERSLSDVKISGDRKRIMQVLMQLIGNAQKYTYNGSISVSVARKGVDFVSVYVKDTGEGIAEENLSRVFERFYRANTRELGNGLGLAICKAIVEQMNGKMGVKSKLGVGSTFWFTVPVA